MESRGDDVVEKHSGDRHARCRRSARDWACPAAERPPLRAAPKLRDYVEDGEVSAKKNKMLAKAAVEEIGRWSAVHHVG